MPTHSHTQTRLGSHWTSTTGKFSGESHSSGLCLVCHLPCSEFRENGGSGGSADTTSILVYRVLISFYGNTSFLSNRGGGVSLLSSRMDIKGGVLFYGNTAVFGGGIAMSGRSLVRQWTHRTLEWVWFTIFFHVSDSTVQQLLCQLFRQRCESVWSWDLCGVCFVGLSPFCPQHWLLHSLLHHSRGHRAH